MDFPPDLAYLEPIVRQTWTAVVQSGKGLELNSYHLSDKAHWHEALVAMLTWYREAGGDNILVNSDAHSTRQIATNRDIAARLLREAGFAVTENKPESIDARF
jgi:histidinol phosphatase-like PHP family hydrolase